MSSRRSCSSSRTPASTPRGRTRSASARTNGKSRSADPTIASVERKTTSGGIRHLTGGSRSASRCFATRRSRKSTRSPSSLICSVRCRISSTSRRSSLTSSAVSSSPSTAPRFFPRMRAAKALPTGEMESRKSAPPPNSRITAARPTILSESTRAPCSDSTYGLVSRLQHLAQEFPRMRALGLRDLLGRPFRHHATTQLPALGAQVDHPIGGLHHIEIVLDDDDRVALVHQPVQYFQQQPYVLEVQSGRRFVQDVQGPARVPFGELRRELHALGFAAREGRCRLSEVDVSQTYVVEQLEFRPDTRLMLEKVERVGDRQVQHVGNRLSFITDLQCFPIVTPSFAHFARDVDVGQKVHLDLHQPVALACLAPAAFDIEREQARVCRRVGPRRAADRALIDVDHLIDVVEPLQTFVRSRHDLGAIEVAC